MMADRQPLDEQLDRHNPRHSHTNSIVSPVGLTESSLLYFVEYSVKGAVSRI